MKYDLGLQQHCLAELVAARTALDDTAIRKAEQAVVLSHLSVAAAVARRYAGRGAPLEDLEQVARLSLVLAIKRWDPDKGADFVGFAVPTISGSLKRWFRDNLQLIRPPRRLQEINAAADQAVEDLRHIGHEPAAAELAGRLGVSVHELDEARTARRSVGSLDVVPELRGSRFEEGTEARIDLQRAISHLSATDRELVELYYVQEWSQTRIARQFGVSQMQVSRLLATVVGTLRTTLAA